MLNCTRYYFFYKHKSQLQVDWPVGWLIDHCWLTCQSTFMIGTLKSEASLMSPFPLQLNLNWAPIELMIKCTAELESNWWMDKSPEACFDHFHHFKVDRLLQTFLAKAKVFQSLHRKPEHFDRPWIFRPKYVIPTLGTPLVASVVQDPKSPLVESQRDNPVRGLLNTFVTIWNPNLYSNNWTKSICWCLFKSFIK